MEDLLFRRNLQLQYHIPFGTELEITHFNILKNLEQNNFAKLHIPHQVDIQFKEQRKKEYSSWIFTYDPTVTKKGVGGEVISPVSILAPSFLNDLEKLCTFLKTYGAKIDESCSAHIHINFNAFLNKNIDCFKKFILILSYYEAELNRFFAGEEQDIRSLAALNYAKSITDKLYFLDKKGLFTIQNWITFLEELKKMKKYVALNVQYAKVSNEQNRNTVEFRTPNASLNPVILENNIYFLLKIVEYCFNQSDWQDLYNKWKYEQLKPHREPEPQKVRTLSRTILTDKEDLKYFDWQYEQGS